MKLTRAAEGSRGSRGSRTGATLNARHARKRAAQLDREIAKMLAGPYFKIGDAVLMGKYKNKRGTVVGFAEDKWGNPTVEIEPVPKGRKQNKIIGLFKIWRADVKEGRLRDQLSGRKVL